MAISILGTFPILNFKKSQTDEYGFDYVSYQYTIKTSTLADYDIKKDDVFTGIESWGGVFFAKRPIYGGAPYVVESVEIKNMPGDLTELTVNTVGTKNSVESNTPRVCLLSSGPLIFGLLGTLGAGLFGYGIASAGQSVEVKFLADGGAAGQAANFAKYFSSLMPATFRGIPLPTQARAPHDFSNVIDTNGIPFGTDGHYYGFVCKSILTEKRGSLLLVTLVFSEAGYAFIHSITGQNSGVATSFYNFPLVG